MSVIRKIIPRRIKDSLKSILGINKSFNIDDLAERIAMQKTAKHNAIKAGRFFGKVAVVTGGGGALGFAIAERLALEGAAVYLCSRDAKNLNLKKEQITKEGGKAYALSLDVTDYSSVENAFRTVLNEQGALDILVNCAGGSARDEWSEIVSQSVENIEKIIDTNLTGTIFCTKAAVTQMVERGLGRIVNISSTVGIGGKAGFSEYAASKYGIIGFTRSLALEVGKSGITVNCVTPGIVNRGDICVSSVSQLIKKNCMDSLGTADDIAYAVAFLSSDEAAFITGQNIIVDGGRSLGLKGD